MQFKREIYFYVSQMPYSQQHSLDIKCTYTVVMNSHYYNSNTSNSCGSNIKHLSTMNTLFISLEDYCIKDESSKTKKKKNNLDAKDDEDETII